MSAVPLTFFSFVRVQCRVLVCPRVLVFPSPSVTRLAPVSPPTESCGRPVAESCVIAGLPLASAWSFLSPQTSKPPVILSFFSVCLFVAVRCLCAFFPFFHVFPPFSLCCGLLRSVFSSANRVRLLPFPFILFVGVPPSTHKPFRAPCRGFRFSRPQMSGFFPFLF